MLSLKDYSFVEFKSFHINQKSVQVHKMPQNNDNAISDVPGGETSNKEPNVPQSEVPVAGTSSSTSNDENDKGFFNRFLKRIRKLIYGEIDQTAYLLDTKLKENEKNKKKPQSTKMTTQNQSIN